MAVLANYFNSELIMELIEKEPLAWLLLCVIVNRLDYKSGTAQVGDFSKLGRGTTEANYRRAKSVLIEKKLCSFKGFPRKGTIATLIDNEIFALNLDNPKKRINDGSKNGSKNGLNELEIEDLNGSENGSENGIGTNNYNNKRYISITREQKAFIEKYFSQDVIEALTVYVNGYFAAINKSLSDDGLDILLKRLKELPEINRVESIENSTVGKYKDFFMPSLSFQKQNKKEVKLTEELEGAF